MRPCSICCNDPGAGPKFPVVAVRPRPTRTGRMRRLATRHADLWLDLTYDEHLQWSRTAVQGFNEVAWSGPAETGGRRAYSRPDAARRAISIGGKSPWAFERESGMGSGLGSGSRTKRNKGHSRESAASLWSVDPAHWAQGARADADDLGEPAVRVAAVAAPAARRLDRHVPAKVPKSEIESSGPTVALG